MKTFILFLLFLNKLVATPEAEKIGTDAYIFGFPLVMMEMKKRVMTNVEEPDSRYAPLGQFSHSRVFPDANSRKTLAPNTDTLTSCAWLDLSKEPFVLHVPDIRERYYLLPLIDGWSEVFASIGSRTTGGGDYVITGPDWKGEIPVNVTQIKAPTNLVWITGRMSTTGTADDYKAVHKLQNELVLTPLSQYKSPSYIAPKGTIDPKVDMHKSVLIQVLHMDSDAFFSLLAKHMLENHPTLEDSAVIAELAKIGLKPGKFEPEPEVQTTLKKVPKMAQDKIKAHQSGKIENGWSVMLKTGVYGTDYLQRAYMAYSALGANRPEDALYPIADTDSSGLPLSGMHSYVIHFSKGEFPPVQGFWSLTLYDPEMLFAPNELHRYALNGNSPLMTNADGSLDLYIQQKSPGPDKESNWLPAPPGRFLLKLRLYQPDVTAISGAWKPPEIRKTS